MFKSFKTIKIRYVSFSAFRYFKRPKNPHLSPRSPGVSSLDGGGAHSPGNGVSASQRFFAPFSEGKRRSFTWEFYIHNIYIHNIHNIYT